MPTTPNHGWVTPTVGASADTWGGLLNAVVDDQDALLAGGQNTILGRITSGTGPMVALTAAQATSALVAFTGDSGLGGVKGLVPAPASGDAAASKFLAASGAWTALSTPIKAHGSFVGSNGNVIAAVGITLTRLSTGVYDATLSPAMPNTNYSVFCGCQSSALAPAAQWSANIQSATKTTTGFRVNVNADAGTTALGDPDQLYIQVLAI